MRGVVFLSGFEGDCSFRVKLTTFRGVDVHEANLIDLSYVCLQQLRADGLELDIVSDIRNFESRMVDVGKPPNHPMISPKWHDFSSSEAFAIVFRKDNQDVGGVAARHLDLGEDSLAQHWATSYARLYQTGAEAPVERFSSVAKWEISGKVVYLGELFLKKGNRDGSICWRLIFHYLFVLCHLKWHPQWIYGFVRQPDVLSGKASRYGFTRQYIGPQEWKHSVGTRSSNEYLVALPRRDLLDAAAFYARHPEYLMPEDVLVQAGKQ